MLQALLGTEKQRNMAMFFLYKHSGCREWVLQHVCMEGGDKPAGEDVFQEVLIVFDRNIREGQFHGNSSMKTYFLGIAKQFWFNQKRRKQAVLDGREFSGSASADSPESKVLEQERVSLINQIMEALGEQCKRILALYKLSLSNEEIAQELNLSSPKLAKKYAYRCREKFRKYVLARKDIMDYLNLSGI